MWKNALIIILIGIVVWLGWERRINEEPISQETGTETARTGLAKVLQAMQEAEGFQAASIGACVLDDSLAPIFAYRANEAMTPASTLKAVTSATALEMLGPAFRFETKLVCTTPFELDESGVLEGDLILLGGGDPVLTSETLDRWATDLNERGLKQVNGGVVADARCYPEAMIPNAWDWGDVSNYYGAGPCGLNLNFNRFEAVLVPGNTLNKPAEIVSLEPSLDWIKRENWTITGKPDDVSWTSIYGGPYTNTLVFRGVIPQGQSAETCHGAIPDPAHYAAIVFKTLLEKHGIHTREDPTTVRRLINQGQSPPQATTDLDSHQSIPLIDIVRYLHRTSDNMVTECLLQKLIERDNEKRGGFAIVKDHWQDRGLDLEGLRMEDGSGLARADYIRPLDLTRVLWLTRRGGVGEAYYQSLNEYFEGRVRWKGGAMSRVRAYTGFITAESGKEFTFSLMINNYHADADAIASWRTKFVQTIMRSNL